MTYTVTATRREEKTGSKKNNSFRARGSIPAVYYGKKNPATSILVDTKSFEKVFEETGESTVVTIDVDGEKIDTLIHDVQVHPVTGRVIHADFYVFDKDQKTTVSVELVFRGESPAEKDGLVINKTMYELEVEALPMNLPNELVVDMTQVKDVESVITAGDITLPTGVVVSVSEEREEEPDETEEEVDMDAIEVEGKGGDDEEGEEESTEE